MTQMPLVAAIALIVTAVLFVVGIITLIVGFATHRVSMESPLADDDDNDDLSDDTATLLSMLPVRPWWSTSTTRWSAAIPPLPPGCGVR